jgi:hypothetical protein
MQNIVAKTVKYCDYLNILKLTILPNDLLCQRCGGKLYYRIIKYPASYN